MSKADAIARGLTKGTAHANDAMQESGQGGDMTIVYIIFGIIVAICIIVGIYKIYKILK